MMKHTRNAVAVQEKLKLVLHASLRHVDVWNCRSCQPESYQLIEGFSRFNTPTTLPLGTPHLHPHLKFNRRLSSPQTRPGRFEEEINILTLPIIEP
jgi:hypothetical protein